MKQFFSTNEAAGRVSQDLTTKGTEDSLAQWIYNGEFSGHETVGSIQAEVNEVEHDVDESYTI